MDTSVYKSPDGIIVEIEAKGLALTTSFTSEQIDSLGPEELTEE